MKGKTKYNSIFLVTRKDYIIGILTKKGKLLKLKDAIKLYNNKKNNLKPWIIKNTKGLNLNKLLVNPSALKLLNEIVLGTRKLPKVDYNLYFKNGIIKRKRIWNNRKQSGGGIKDLNLEDFVWVKRNKNLIFAELDKIKQNNLTEKYIKHKKLGEGSMGDVYLVEEKSTGNMFALKTIENEMYYLKEIQNLNHLEKECSRFPCIYEIGVYSKKFAIIEDLIEGVDLYDIFEKEEIKFTESQMESTLRDLSSDLILLHSINISHRDIKTENIVMDKNLNAKFIDFGLSCIGHKKCSAVGTPELMLPRLARLLIDKDSTLIDNSIWMDADWYSLGIVIKELVDYYKRTLYNREIRSPLIKDFIKITVTNERSRTIKVKQWLLKYKILQSDLPNLFENLKI